MCQIHWSNENNLIKTLANQCALRVDNITSSHLTILTALWLSNTACNLCYVKVQNFTKFLFNVVENQLCELATGCTHLPYQLQAMKNRSAFTPFSPGPKKIGRVFKKRVSFGEVGALAICCHKNWMVQTGPREGCLLSNGLQRHG